MSKYSSSRTSGNRDTFVHPLAIFWVSQEEPEAADVLPFSLASTDSDGCTPLMYAVTRQHAKLTQRLLAVANLNARDRGGKTALHYALLSGNRAVARELILAGAAVDMADKDGTTSLMIAALFGYDDLVRLIMKHGGRADQRDSNGRSAKAYAASMNHRHIIDVLARVVVKQAETSV